MSGYTTTVWALHILPADEPTMYACETCTIPTKYFWATVPPPTVCHYMGQ